MIAFMGRFGGPKKPKAVEMDRVAEYFKANYSYDITNAGNPYDKMNARVQAKIDALIEYMVTENNNARVLGSSYDETGYNRELTNKLTDLSRDGINSMSVKDKIIEAIARRENELIGFKEPRSERGSKGKE